MNANNLLLLLSSSAGLLNANNLLLLLSTLVVVAFALTALGFDDGAGVDSNSGEHVTLSATSSGYTAFGASVHLHICSHATLQPVVGNEEQVRISSYFFDDQQNAP